MTPGHMNYDDTPIFYSGLAWEKEQREKREIYKEDLYKFTGDEIAITELIGSKPIRHIYENSYSADDQYANKKDEDFMRNP